MWNALPVKPIRLALNSTRKPIAITMKIIERNVEILPVRKIRNAHNDKILIHVIFAEKRMGSSLLINMESKNKITNISSEIIRLAKNVFFILEPREFTLAVPYQSNPSTRSPFGLTCSGWFDVPVVSKRSASNH